MTYDEPEPKVEFVRELDKYLNILSDSLRMLLLEERKPLTCSIFRVMAKVKQVHLPTLWG